MMVKMEHLQTTYGGENRVSDRLECISKCEGLQHLMLSKFSHLTTHEISYILCTNSSYEKLAYILALIPVSTAERDWIHKFAVAHLRVNICTLHSV